VELRELRAFVAVVEEGGISAAARRLHLSQPSLTQAMHALERELGVPLLTRTSSGTRPTDAGRTLAVEARAVLARHDEAVAAVTRHGVPGGGELRLGVPLELPPEVLAAPIAALAAACPDTRIRSRHLSTAAQLAALRAGELDAGLVREHPIGPDVDAAPVLDEPLGVLVAADVLAALAPAPAGPDGHRAVRLDALTPGPAGPDGHRAVRLDALRGLEWVGFARSGSPAWYDQVTAVLRGHGVDPGPEPPEGVNFLPELKLAQVASGQAFAFAPRAWSVPIPDHVVWAPLAGHPVVRRTWVAWPAASRRRDVGRLVAALEELWSPAER
jgi:DNA-binding transcriptional LysR family regulator